MTVFTIGHSTRPIDTFLSLLAGHQIRHLVDVRKIPRSRHNPQFADDRLAASLAAAHIRYTHMPGLGGLRRPRPDSVNVGWRNSGFRGFADYMQTPAFDAALANVSGAGNGCDRGVEAPADVMQEIEDQRMQDQNAIAA